jgi:hypothetical protein
MNKIELPQNILKIKEQLSELDEEYEIIGNKQRKLEDKLITEVRSIIKNNNILNRYKWDLNTHLDEIYLSSKDRDDYYIGQLTLVADYHYSFELESGITFHSNDGEITICFEEDTDPFKFIKDWNISLSLKCIDSQIDKSRASIKKNEINLNKLIVIKDKYYKINE